MVYFLAPVFAGASAPGAFSLMMLVEITATDGLY
jgi:hypothetical protein